MSSSDLHVDQAHVAHGHAGNILIYIKKFREKKHTHKKMEVREQADKSLRLGVGRSLRL